MSKEGTFARYICDRPAETHIDGKEVREYIKDGNVKENDWHQIEYTDINGSTSKYWLCKECYSKYLEMKSSFDQMLAGFMSGANKGEE